jgi:uncharacterized membrane protein YhaH (DUF805 family)
MTTTSTDAPSNSADADASAQSAGPFQSLRLWSFHGRLGRLRFVAYSVVAYLLAVTAAVIPMLVTSLSRAGDELLLLFWVVLLLPYLVFIASVTIRRSHDMGWSGWGSLLALIPLLGLVWVFKAGNSEANAYGAPPPPNTTGVKLCAFGPLLLILLGIVVGISVPAYTDYKIRSAVTNALTSARPLQRCVTEHYVAQRVLRMEPGECGVEKRSAEEATGISDVTVSTDGVIAIRFGADVGSAAGKSIELAPEPRPDQGLVWSCKGGDLPAADRPSACR